MPDITDQAIKAALDQQWEQAIELNQAILAENPEDIATLNRLGFAHRQLGQIKEARLAYQQVIHLDRFNPIAQKSLDKLSSFNTNTNTSHNESPRVKTSFIEEPGKTKTVQLVRPTQSDLVLNLNPGTPVILLSMNRHVRIVTQSKKYIGFLPDDLGYKLGKLMRLGYKYQAVVKSAENKSITIFIIETNRSKKGKNLPSFSSSSSVLLSQPKTQTLDEIPIDITPTGEDDEATE